MAKNAAPEPGATSAPPQCRVCLTDEASIVDRGEELRVWYVRQADSWTKAKELTSEETEALETAEEVPPGVVWRRTTELVLPLGTWLMRRVTSPRVERRDPLDYLTRGALGTGRAVRETYFRVAGNYRLVEGVFRDGPARG